MVQRLQLICEIEKECLENPITIKRFDFYSKIGFKRTGSEYLLYNVLYTPLIYINSDNIIKEEADKMFFEYYRVNCGEKKVKKNCKIIKQEVTFMNNEVNSSMNKKSNINGYSTNYLNTSLKY